MHRQLIQKVINSNDIEKLKKIANLEIDTIDILKDYNKQDYEYIETDLYEIVEGKKLTEEMTKEWVEQMRPKGKWTIDEIKSVKDRLNIDIPLIDLYALMNMLYSDFGDIIGENITEEVLTKYVKFAEAWYFDEDIQKSGAEKLYCYYRTIVRIK